MTDNTKEKIIEAAMRVFSKYGFFRASLRLIAKEAGVSKSLIFWYFRSKDELIFEVALRSLPLDIINECLKEGNKGIDALRCVGVRYVKKYEKPLYRYLLLHVFSAEAVYPQIKENIEKMCHEQLDRVAEAVYGEISEKSRIAIMTFLGSLLCFTLRKPINITSEKYVEVLIDIIFDSSKSVAIH